MNLEPISGLISIYLSNMPAGAYHRGDEEGGLYHDGKKVLTIEPVNQQTSGLLGALVCLLNARETAS